MRKPTARKLRRKQVYIEPDQDARLKQLARDWGVTEAELIRRALDRQLGGALLLPPDRAAWESEKAFLRERENLVCGPSQGRRWTREELYEDRLSRYGREP